MQIEVTARNLDLTQSIEQYAERKADKLPRYFDRIQRIEIILGRTKVGYKSESRIEVEHHDPFVASVENDDLYACIDLLVDRAARQLKDHKTRLRDDRKHAPVSGRDA